jgi:hypothetical protein
MDYSDDGDFENEDEKHLLDLVPSVLETMNNCQIPYMLYHNNNSKMDGLHVQCTWSITF